MALDFNKAAIYVGTYGKYAAGSIAGAWLTLSDYSNQEEFLAACKELHKDEANPEFDMQDYEFLPECLANTVFHSNLFWDLADNLDYYEEEAFAAWLDCRGSYDVENGDEADDLISTFRDSYVGQYDSEEDFAEQYANECMEIPEGLYNYIDFGRLARDIFIDMTFWDGYVFNPA